MRSWVAVIGLVLLVPSGAAAQWLAVEVPGRPEPNAQLATDGRTIYGTHCWFCHGDEGDGLGPIAKYLWPRPRDFTIASFKFRTTPSGELPTDEDLYRTISLGVPGTAMPAWRSVLTAEERWQVIAYLKSFADGMFEDAAFDPYATVIDIGSGPDDPLPSLIEAGRTAYEESDCWECHGTAGRGDGPKSDQLRDDWGYPIWATDLELGWKFRGGSTPREVFLRLTTGLDGTPMPSYAETLTEKERWQVAYYVASLEERGTREGMRPVVIPAARVDGALPQDPGDPGWNDATPVWIPLAGQGTYPPRWQNPAVSDIQVQAMYNEDELAFRIRWNDRTADSVEADAALAELEGWSSDDTYPVIFPDGVRRRGSYGDGLEILFPEADQAPVLPHFVYGDSQRPVNLWRWTPGGNMERASVTEWVVEGPHMRLPLPPDRQRAAGRGVWADGRWTVVLRSPLEAGVAFRPGGLVPVAFHVRDGAHGETGLRMSLSSWYFLHLREPAGIPEALIVLFAVLGTGAAEYAVVRVMRRRARDGQLRAFGISP